MAATMCTSAAMGLRSPNTVSVPVKQSTTGYSSNSQVSFVPGRSFRTNLRATRASPRMEAGPQVGQGSTGSTLTGEGTAPLGVISTPASLPHGDTPVDERIAYICQDCGYIYDSEAPFEDQPDESYNCPVCSAPKARFLMQNTTVGESKASNEDL